MKIKLLIVFLLVFLPFRVDSGCQDCHCYDLSFDHSLFLIEQFKLARYEKTRYLKSSYPKEQQEIINNLIERGYLELLNHRVALTTKAIVYIQIELLQLDKREI